MLRSSPRGIVGLLVGMCLAGSLAAQDAGSPEAATPSEETIAALPEGQVKVLSAVVMEATGRVQWKAPEEGSKWAKAQADDILPVGASIRTGRKSSLALRVGHNATILVERNTRMVIPQMLQEGETLKTAVQLTRGRAQFKVDKVGLTNDFSVVTPSTTMAVRGTGGGIDYGGFDGTDIFVSQANTLRAVEVRYFGALFKQYLTQKSGSSNTSQNPAVKALFDTFGPPAISNVLTTDQAAMGTLAAGVAGGDGPGGGGIVILTPDTVNETRSVDLARQSTMGTIMQVDPPAPPPPPPPSCDTPCPLKP